MPNVYTQDRNLKEVESRARQYSFLDAKDLTDIVLVWAKIRDLSCYPVTPECCSIKPHFQNVITKFTQDIIFLIDLFAWEDK
jgi:hypothetical protein